LLLARDETASEEEWKQLADNAFTAGKLQFAREGYRMAGDRKGIDKVDKILKPETEEEASGDQAEGETEEK
jgi:hypothetical protein